MGLRKIRSDSYLANKLNWSIEKNHVVGDRLGYLGTIRTDFKKDGHYNYFLPIFAPGLLEIMVVSPNAKEHPLEELLTFILTIDFKQWHRCCQMVMVWCMKFLLKEHYQKENH